jgi:hypothetical protein
VNGSGKDRTVPRLSFPKEAEEASRKRWAEQKTKTPRGPKGCDVSRLLIVDARGKERKSLAIPDALNGADALQLGEQYRHRKALALGGFFGPADAKLFVAIKTCKGEEARLKASEILAEPERYLLSPNSNGTLKLLDSKQPDKRRLARDVIALELVKGAKP